MPKYKVRDGEFIQHDGKDYNGGDVLTCTEEQAKMLRVDVVDAPVKKERLPADDAIAAVNACETIDAVRDLLKGEDRTTVIDAGKAKIKAIKDAEKK